MSIEIPTDLIHQVQIALRKDAGLSSYIPPDTTPSPIPSITAAIADLDQSSSSVQCNYCQGRLLSGMQSMICIYCGKQQKGDVPREPIAFNSTYAYRFLLGSLGLDGLEIVVPVTEESEIIRGQRTPKDEISLFKLLDLRIPWLDAPGISGTSDTDKNLEPNRSLLTLTGVDLVNYLKEPDSNIVFNAFQGQPVQPSHSKSIKNEEVIGQDNIDLFQNVPEESGDDLSGWEASFQFANNHNQQESLNSADFFPSSNINLTAHIDSVFGSGENFNDVKPNADLFLAPSTVNNLKEDDLLTSSLSQPLDSAYKDVNDQSSGNGDLFQDNEWHGQSTASTSVDNKVNSADSQPFDPSINDVNDQASNNGDWFEDNQWQSQNTIDVGVDNHVNSAESQTLESASKDFNAQSSDKDEWFQDNQWQSQSTVNVGSKVESTESQPLDSASAHVKSHTSGNGDLLEDNQWQSQSTVNITVDNDVNWAESQRLDSASKKVKGQSSDNGDWFPDNQWQSQSTVNMGVDDNVSSAEPQLLNSTSENDNNLSSDKGDWFKDNQWQSQTTENVGVDNNVNSAESRPLDSVSNDVNDQSAYTDDWFPNNQWQSQSTVNMSVDNNVSSAEPQLLNSASKNVNGLSSDNGDWFEDNQWQSQSTENVGVGKNVNSAESVPLDLVLNDVNDQSAYTGDWFPDNQWQSQSSANIGVDNKVNCDESQPFDSDSKDVDDQSLYTGDWFEGNQWQRSSVVGNEVNSAESQPSDLPTKDFNNQSSENGDWLANQWQSQSTVNVEVDNKADSAEFQPLALPSENINNQSSDTGDWFADNQWQSPSTVHAEVDNKAESAEFQTSDVPTKDFNNQSLDNGDWFVDNQWQSQSTANGVVDEKNSAEYQLDPGSKDLNYHSSDGSDWFQANMWQSQISINSSIDNKANTAESQSLDSAINRSTLTNPSTESFDWFNDNQWQTNIASVPNIIAVNETENHFDEWNEFTSSNSPQAIVQETGPESPNIERKGDLSSKDENTDKVLKPEDDKAVEKKEEDNEEALMSSMYDFSLMRPNSKVNNDSSQPLDSDSKNVNGHSSDDVNLFQDDQLQSQNAVNVCLEKEVKSEEAQPLDSAVNNLPLPESDDWLNDNQWRTIFTTVSNDKTIDENEDSLDEWNDFTSANNPEDVSSITNAIQEKISVMNNSHNTYQEVDLGSFFPGDFNLKRNVDVNSSTLKPKDDIEMFMSPMQDFSVKQENIVSNHASSQPLDSNNVGWFQDNQWQSQSMVNAGSKKLTSVESQPLDSAVNTLNSTNPSSHSLDWFNENKWQTNITSTPNDNTIDENEDSFDEWNDFTSANNPQEISSSIEDKNLNANMFSSPGNFQELDFGSFFSGGSSSKRDGNSDIDTILKPKDDANAVTSRMHDFSFLLENNPSTSQKAETIDSFSHH